MPLTATISPSPAQAAPVPPAAPRGSLYADLSRQVKQAGLLERRLGNYVRKMVVMTALLIGGGVAFVLIGDSWWTLAIAALLAVVFTQLGFIGHEAGHQQIFTSKRANYLTGLVYANLCIGLSYGWWVDKHNRHHAHPNHEEKDPDVKTGALAFSKSGAGKASRGAQRFYRYQAFLFFPMLTLEGMNLHIASLRALTRRPLRARAGEAALFAVHVIVYVTGVFLVLSPGKALAFIAVHQGLFGLYLGCSFAPNHKGMPELTPDQNADFLLRQVLTSRNVRPGVITDFALGGLNYQIEHHLFPSMPRPNLRKAQVLVRDFCAQHDVSYLQTGLIASYRQALGHLNEVGRSTGQA